MGKAIVYKAGQKLLYQSGCIGIAKRCEFVGYDKKGGLWIRWEDGRLEWFAKQKRFFKDIV